MSSRIVKISAGLVGLVLAASTLASCATADEPASAARVSTDVAPAAAPVIEPVIPVELATTEPVSIDEYVEAFSGDGWTHIDGVEDEYAAAASVFPLALPEGWAFPAQSRLAGTTDEPGTRYQSGFGSGEVFFFWRAATALAAHTAHLNGDDAAAARHLDALEEGFQTSITHLHYEDPDGLFLDAIEKARGGSYGVLRQFSVNSFLDDPAFRAIAKAAGDMK